MVLRSHEEIVENGTFQEHSAIKIKKHTVGSAQKEDINTQYKIMIKKKERKNIITKYNYQSQRNRTIKIDSRLRCNNPS